MNNISPKNERFIYLPNIRKLICFFTPGKDGRDGINGDVVICLSEFFYLDWKYFEHEFLHKQSGRD